jgi:hypothetical protein
LAERKQVARFGLVKTNALIDEKVHGKSSYSNLRSADTALDTKAAKGLAENLHIGGLCDKTKDAAVLLPEWTLVVLQPYILYLLGKGILGYFR